MIDLATSTGLFAGLFGLLATFSLAPTLFLAIILLFRRQLPPRQMTMLRVTTFCSVVFLALFIIVPKG